MKRLLGPNMNLHAEQVLKILNQSGVVQQTASRFPLDQQIEVAALPGLAAGHRAKDTQIARASFPSQTEYLRTPVRAQCFQVDHGPIVRQFRSSRTFVRQVQLDGSPPFPLTWMRWR